MQYIHYPQNGSIKLGNLAFSNRELKDLALAWIAISFAFANIMSGGISGLMTAFIISSLTVGVGFIFHEMGHKILAQKYGAWAEFRAWKQMLLLAVLFSFAGFVFAAPGAVMIAGRTIGKSRNGKISAMGPLINFIIAILFIPLIVLFPGTILGTIGIYGSQINTWLGLFNLIPFAMFDGKKVFEWSKPIYASLVVLGIFLYVIQAII